MWHVTSKLHAQHDDIELDNGMGLSLSTMGIRKYVRLCNINESMMHCNLSNTKKGYLQHYNFFAPFLDNLRHNHVTIYAHKWRGYVDKTHVFTVLVFVNLEVRDVNSLAQ